VFAIMGATLRLGAFATFDAMSLCLLALSAWSAVRASERSRTSGWLAAAAYALALADATKYASALFDPVVIGMLMLLVARRSGWNAARRQGATFAAYTVSLLAFMLAFGGGEYLTGIWQTTLGRAAGTTATHTVVITAWRLTAVVVVLAAVGAIMAPLARQPWTRCLFILLLLGAAVLVPLEQARIHTITSLDKHVDFGAWFAAIAAGYAIDVVARLGRPAALQWSTAAICLVLLVPTTRLGLTQARAMFATWPNSATLVRTLTTVVPKTSGPIFDDSSRAVLEYYLPRAGTDWERWSTASSFRLPSGKALSVPVGETVNPAVYRRCLRAGCFSLVILTFGSAAPFDSQILPALTASQNYHLVALVPYGTRTSQIWEYEPQAQFRSARQSTALAAGPSLLQSVLMPTPRLRPLMGSVSTLVLGSGVCVASFTILVRFGWRRGKASDEV